MTDAATNLDAVLAMARTRPKVKDLTDAIASLDGSPALASPRVRANIASYGVRGDGSAQEAAILLLTADRRNRAAAEGWLLDPSYDRLREARPVRFMDAMRGVPYRYGLAELDAIGERAAETLARQAIDGPISMLARLRTVAGRKGVAAATGYDEATLLGWVRLAELALLRVDPLAFPPAKSAKPPSVTITAGQESPTAAASILQVLRDFAAEAFGATPEPGTAVPAPDRHPGLAAALKEVNLLFAASISSCADLAKWTDIDALGAAVRLANARVSMLETSQEETMLEGLPAWRTAAGVERVYPLVEEPPASTGGEKGDEDAAEGGS